MEPACEAGSLSLRALPGLHTQTGQRAPEEACPGHGWQRRGSEARQGPATPSCPLGYVSGLGAAKSSSGSRSPGSQGQPSCTGWGAGETSGGEGPAGQQAGGVPEGGLPLRDLGGSWRGPLGPPLPPEQAQGEGVPVLSRKAPPWHPRTLSHLPAQLHRPLSTGAFADHALSPVGLRPCSQSTPRPRHCPQLMRTWTCPAPRHQP